LTPFILHNILHALKTHSGVRRYGQNIGWLFLEKAFRMIVTLFVGIWVVRYLGPEHFGLLSYAQSIALILIAVSGLGLDEIIVKEILRSNTDKQSLLTTAITLKLMSSIAMLAILSTVLFLNTTDSQSLWLILIVSLSSIFTSFSSINNYFQANVNSKYTVIANMLAFSLISLFKILLILLHASVTAFAIVNLIEYALITFFLIYFYHKISKVKLTLWIVDLAIVKRLITLTWPLTIAATLAVLLDNINQLMISWMINLDALGHYVAAARLSEVWFFVGAAVVSTFSPALFNAQIQDDAKYQRRTQRLFDLLVVLALAIAVPVSIFSKEITLLIYGEAYLDSAVVLGLHVSAAIFVFSKAASTQWLIIHQLQKYTYYQNLIAILTTITLNLLLIPSYGIMGSAMAFLIATFVAFYLVLAFSHHTRPCFVMQTKALMFGFLFRKQF
jgi:O-antigen/teichoic acid export membrane protein